LPSGEVPSSAVSRPAEIVLGDHARLVNAVSLQASQSECYFAVNINQSITYPPVFSRPSGAVVGLDLRSNVRRHPVIRSTLTPVQLEGAHLTATPDHPLQRVRGGLAALGQRQKLGHAGQG